MAHDDAWGSARRCLNDRVEIRTAYATSLYGDADLARPEWEIRAVFQAEGVGAVVDEGSHERFSCG
jgi:hypothetical protein